MIPVHVVGLGMFPEDLTPRALEIIREAQVLVGGRRVLGYFPEHPARKITLGKDPEATLAQIPALAAESRVVVLASGDPFFYGVGPLVVKLLGADRVVVHPNITAVQAACARLQIAWQTAQVISLHGRSWELLDEALDRAGKLIVYTDPEHTPAAIARLLLARGQGEARLCVLEDLGQETERVTWPSPEEAKDREFSPLNMVVILPLTEAAEATISQDDLPSPQAARLHLGLPEEALAHQRGLITKAEVRAVVLAKLELYPGLVLWDVGAGCGSVGLEASLLLPGGKIIAVEQDKERAAQIRANGEKFGVGNLEVVCGHAPGCLTDLPTPQRVFIGGGGRDLEGILKEVLGRLDRGGRAVITVALLETLETTRAVLSEAGWKMEVVQLQVSRSQPLARGIFMQALNPVWIVTAYQ
ncbi:MAG: precorrin-6y C5,15-methyltransferase (decarboxylating) subunit CbiE [Deltaproteobacteria bacterium]|nr:precorrin-6y C5,15-methyltransferase (decarboxylating) subunit CbiE [Deltaproteobacteria bacterium]